MNTCSTCRYWSDLIAESRAIGVVALCLAPTRVEGGRNLARHRGEFTPATCACECWASDHLGPIDAPGSDPLRYEAERCDV